jgi:hypothetical protein
MLGCPLILSVGTTTTKAIPARFSRRSPLPEDPIRLYLREIGKIYLLTANDEKHLARQIEEGNHLRAIEDAYFVTYNRPPSAARVVVSLLEQWTGLLLVYDAAKSFLDDYDKLTSKVAPVYDTNGVEIPVPAPRWRVAGMPKLKHMKSSEVLTDSQYRGLIDAEMDQNFRSYVAAKLKKTEEEAQYPDRPALDRDPYHHPRPRRPDGRRGGERG